MGSCSCSNLICGKSNFQNWLRTCGKSFVQLVELLSVDSYACACSKVDCFRLSLTFFCISKGRIDRTVEKNSSALCALLPTAKKRWAVRPEADALSRAQERWRDLDERSSRSPSGDFLSLIFDFVVSLVWFLYTVSSNPFSAVCSLPNNSSFTCVMRVRRFVEGRYSKPSASTSRDFPTLFHSESSYASFPSSCRPKLAPSRLPRRASSTRRRSYSTTLFLSWT
jgi:hypothetical protein